MWIGIILLALIVVGLPVVLGIMSDVWKRRIAFEERKMELMAAQAAERAAQYAASNMELEQRVRVLEQIVTDAGAQTANQIEALRGASPSSIRKVEAAGNE